jgi:hypothetical protein
MLKISVHSISLLAAHDEKQCAARSDSWMRHGCKKPHEVAQVMLMQSSWHSLLLWPLKHPCML